MKRFLTTLTRDGSVDFCTCLLEIKKYDSRDKCQIEAILSSMPETLRVSWHADVLSLFFHEYTHYLDVTCTAWGLEFLLRKHNVAKSLGDIDKIEEYSPVFMLNLAEITVHSKLLEIHNVDINLTECKTEHSALYSEIYGPIIVVYFSRDDKKVLSTPLSMLSVLESNAYASEILCKIRYLEANNLSDDLLLLEIEVNKYLSSPELSEYSLLIILCRKHFEYLSLKECLVFYQSLVWRILNMMSANLSTISAFLKYTFKNTYVGNAICKDLQRGMSRHVVVFKLILMIHQFINESDNKQRLIEILKNDPKKILGIFFEENSISVIESLDAGDWTEYTVYMDMIEEYQDFQERELMANSSRSNHEKLKKYGWNELSLSDFLLPDSFFSDGTVIGAPNRVACDVERYFEYSLAKMSEIEKIYRETDVSKFHIHPDDVSHV